MASSMLGSAASNRSADSSGSRPAADSGSSARIGDRGLRCARASTRRKRRQPV